MAKPDGGHQTEMELHAHLFRTWSLTPFLNVAGERRRPRRFVSAGDADPGGLPSADIADVLPQHSIDVTRLLFASDGTPPLANEQPFNLKTEASNRALRHSIDWLKPPQLTGLRAPPPLLWLAACRAWCR